MKNVILLNSLLLLLLTTDGFSQVRISIFYDSTWAINSREQASYFRNGFIDTTYFAFLGPVQDNYASGNVAMKGAYQGGIKQGQFVFYYENGKEKCKGDFVNNQPAGLWRFYYENGKHWQTIEFVPFDFKVLRYHDKSGNEKVKNGNGRWEGKIYSYSRTQHLYVDGMVESGVKDGMWVFFDEAGNIIYEEKYVNGQLKFTKMYDVYGQLLGKFDKPVGNTLIIPYELGFTEKMVFAPDVRQSDYPLLSFLPDEDTVYFDKNWEECDSAEAYYFRPTNVQNIKKPTGIIRDYYMNGQLQKEGKYKAGARQGPFKFYHANGAQQRTGSYSDGKQTGEWRFFYENGKPYQTVYYEDGRMLIDQYWSEENEQLISNGSGFYSAYFEEHDQKIKMEGKYLDYAKHGDWTGYREDGSLYFKETYEQGKLISGTSYDDAGNEYVYVVTEEKAMPSRGMKHFYQFVGERLSYPLEARKLNIEGKVFIQFEVDKNGVLMSAEAIRSPHELLSKSAESVVSRYDEWQPGKIRGQFVNMKFILPITFRLGGYEHQIIVDDF